MADSLKQGPPDKPPGYLVIQLPLVLSPEEVTDELNTLEKDGWRVVCSYGDNNIILERGYNK